MLAEQNEKRFTAALNCLCKNISRRLLPLAPKLANSVQEIRLRLSRPLALVCPDNTYYLTQNGGLSNTILDGAMLVVSKADIVDTFNNICNYSVYNRQNETLEGKGNPKTIGFCWRSLAPFCPEANTHHFSRIFLCFFR